MVTVKRVAYAYNSEVPEKPYFLDAYVYQDGVKLVDVHGSFATRGEFDEAIEGITLELPNEDTEDERRDSEEVLQRGEAGQV